MQRYFAKEYKDKIILEDSDIHHIKNVMRMKIGECIEVVYNNKLHICKIDNIETLDLTVTEVIDEENKLNLDITIAVALVKEQKMDLILQKLTELGVNRIIPVIESVMSIKELAKVSADFKLVASTKEKSKMLNYYLQKIDKCAKIILVVGPEGGISDREEAILNENGFQSISFGNLVFRVETAAIYAASIFNFYSSMR